MRYFWILFFVFVTMSSVSKSQVEPKVIGIDELIQWFEKNNDTTYIFNFWATWCKPCIEELPAFQKVQQKYEAKKLQLILVSLDFTNTIEDQLKPFIENHNIQTPVFVLSEPDPNSWIDQVSTDWSGAIPATLIINNQQKIRKFYEKQFTFTELKQIVQKITDKS